MNDIEEWVRDHDLPLADIARDTSLPERLVHLAAALVLEGVSDDEIHDILLEHIVSMDGQRDPLAGAPRALELIRLLASA